MARDDFPMFDRKDLKDFPVTSHPVPFPGRSRNGSCDLPDGGEGETSTWHRKNANVLHNSNNNIYNLYVYLYIHIWYIYIRYLRYIYSHILYIHYIILYIPYYITYYIFSTRLLLILILFCVAIKGEPSGLGIGIDSQARFLVAKKHDIEA